MQAEGTTDVFVQRGPVQLQAGRKDNLAGPHLAGAIRDWEQGDWKVWSVVGIPWDSDFGVVSGNVLSTGMGSKLGPETRIKDVSEVHPFPYSAM